MDYGAAIAEIYRQEVTPFKTRTVSLPGRKCEARIMYTFLGFEVKAGRKRLLCPDLVTARYLRVFAELGMKQVLIPYDPTRTGRLIDRLERNFEKLKDSARGDRLRSAFGRLRRQLAVWQAKSNF
ncbi:MAG: hypothetical protein HY315_02225 [Acidobacteria bacterium]|nr:hypothetical protein [Acidobacteriota bacterium]